MSNGLVDCLVTDDMADWVWLEVIYHNDQGWESPKTLEKLLPPEKGLRYQQIFEYHIGRPARMIA